MLLCQFATGKLDKALLDVTGAEQARKVQNPASEPSNVLLDRALMSRASTNQQQDLERKAEL